MKKLDWLDQRRIVWTVGGFLTVLTVWLSTCSYLEQNYQDSEENARGRRE